MYCKHCGKEIGDGAAFCQHCGKPITSPAASSTSPERKSKTPLIVILAVICVIAVAAVGLLAKYSADRKRAEAEALAASIAESEAIAESIAQAEAIAESIAEAEAIAESIALEEAAQAEQLRKDYIAKLNHFIELVEIGSDTGIEICNWIYMVWYDTNYEQYREETAAFTMIDGVYHEYIDPAFDALCSDQDFIELVESFVANKDDVANAYQALANPPEEFTSHYHAAEDLLDAYIVFWNFTNTIPSGTLDDYYNDCMQYSTDFSETFEKLLILVPTDSDK